MKTLHIWGLNDGYALESPVLNTSVRIIRNEAVVWWWKASIGSQGHYKNCLDNSTKRKLLTSILQSQSKIQKLFLLWKWLSVGMKLHLIGNSIFTDLSPYQGNFLHLIDFLRQAVTLSQDLWSNWVIFSNKVSAYKEELSPLDLISQTSDTLARKLFYLKRLWRTSCLTFQVTISNV